MKRTNQITVLEVKNQVGTVYPALIEDEQDLYLVDTGFPSQFDALKTAVQKAGYSIEQITGIILTHQDLDHIGNIIEVKNASPQAKVYAHVDEAPYIDGSQTPVKVAGLASRLDTLPPEKKQFFAEYKKAFENRRTAIDVPLGDGDPIGRSTQIKAIHTPGHTPGHICLYCSENGILISGDALNIREGKLCGPSTEHTQNMEQALHSVRAMLRFDIQTVASYHGGVYAGEDICRQLEAIADQSI